MSAVDTWRSIVLEEACPTCGAAAGAACTSRTGKLASSHAARHDSLNPDQRRRMAAVTRRHQLGGAAAPSFDPVLAELENLRQVAQMLYNPRSGRRGFRTAENRAGYNDAVRELADVLDYRIAARKGRAL